MGSESTLRGRAGSKPWTQSRVDEGMRGEAGLIDSGRVVTQEWSTARLETIEGKKRAAAVILHGLDVSRSPVTRWRGPQRAFAAILCFFEAILELRFAKDVKERIFAGADAKGRWVSQIDASFLLMCVEVDTVKWFEFIAFLCDELLGPKERRAEMPLYDALHLVDMCDSMSWSSEVVVDEAIAPAGRHQDVVGSSFSFGRWRLSMATPLLYAWDRY